MSRGFVKEGDQEEDIFIQPRASLPAGISNYVTPQGYKELVEEKENLEEEFKSIPKDHEPQHRRAISEINGKIALLNERILSARIILPEDQPEDEVRFGAFVEFLNGSKKLKFQIVGVDEADIKKQKISFLAPIVTALTGLKAGEETDFMLGNKVQKLKVISIKY